MSSELITKLEPGQNVQLYNSNNELIDYPFLNSLIGRFNGNMHSSSGNNTVWYLKVGIDPEKRFILYRLTSTSVDHISNTVTLRIESHPTKSQCLRVTRDDITLKNYHILLSHIPSFASTSSYLMLEAKQCMNIRDDNGDTTTTTATDDDDDTSNAHQRDELQQVTTFTFSTPPVAASPAGTSSPGSTESSSPSSPSSPSSRGNHGNGTIISIVSSNYQDGLLFHTDCGVLYPCDRNAPPHFDVVEHDRVNSPRVEELQ